jgi:hypothetical protein
MRRLMGDAAPDDCLDAHQTLKHKMARLADTHISDPNYDVLVADYMKVGRGFAAPLVALAYLPWSRAAAQQPACALLQSHSVAAAANTTCATCVFSAAMRHERLAAVYLVTERKVVQLWLDGCQPAGEGVMVIVVML